MKTIRWSVLVILILGMAWGMFGNTSTLPTTHAQVPSAGCTAINGGALNGTNAGVIGPVATLDAGETVTINVVDVGGGVDGNLDINGAFQGAITTPGSAAYVANGTTGASSYSGVGTQVTVSCTPVGGGGPVVTTGIVPAVELPPGLDPNGDRDEDGVVNGRDNCIFKANKDQANTWGSSLGNACDNEYFDNGGGTKIFQMVNNLFEVYGSCFQSQCQLIAVIDPRALSPEGGPFIFQVENPGNWKAQVDFLSFGSQIYQVTVLDGAGAVQTRAFQIVIADNGRVSWKVGTNAGPSVSVVSGGNFNVTTISGEEPIVGVNNGSAEGGAAAGPVQPGQNGVAGSGLIVRTEPRENAIRMTQQILYGTPVFVVRADDSGYWFLVRGGGIEGWVPAEFILPEGSIGPLAPPAPVYVNSVVRPGGQGVVTAGTFMRNSPDGTRTFQMPQGLIVNVISEDSSTAWYLVESQGAQGWINAVSLGEVGTAGRLFPTVPTDVKPGEAAITVREVSARADASNGAPATFVLPSRTMVTVRELANQFILVQFTGGTGWVPFGSLAAVPPLSPIPVTDAPVAVAPAPAAPAQQPAAAQAAAPAQTTVQQPAAPAQQPAQQQPPTATPRPAPTATLVPTQVPASTSFSANDRVRPGTCAVTIGTVRVREQPNLSAKELGQVMIYTRADILAEDGSGFWFQVRAIATVTDADGNQTQQEVTGWAANEWFGRPGDFLTRGGGSVPDKCN